MTRPGLTTRRRASPERGARGFTLLETMIALAIAALALVALFRGAETGLRTTVVAEHVQEAISRARSRLAALSVAVQPSQASGQAMGDASGDDGGGYSWRTTVAPDEARVEEGGVPLYRVTVSVSWDMDGGPRTVSLSSWRLGSPAAR